MKFETKAIRLQTERSVHQEHSTPIFPTSSFVFKDVAQMQALFSGDEEGNIYSRYSNPSVAEFESKIAALENTEMCVATASGMAAVFATFMSHLKSGDHVLSTRAVFGSSYKVLSDSLPQYGIQSSFVDAIEIDKWEAELKDNTRMLYIETPSNPGLTLVDLEAASDFCKKHNLIFVVDNCFASPYLQQPAKFGADIIVHSATKFIDGQGRVLGGAITGSEALINPIYLFIRRTGATLSPFNAWVLSKSLETLAVRMDRHCDNALKLTQYLKQSEHVKSVSYPFDADHPQVELAKKQMSQGGGIVTFRIEGGIEAGVSFLNNLKLISLTANLGDTRTIASHPASTTHLKVPEEERLSVGITNDLIRISVGLEHIDDLISDMTQAFKG